MHVTNILLFLGGLGGMEVVLIILAILLFFGAKRIPELAKGLGRGIREFKDASKEIKEDFVAFNFSGTYIYPTQNTLVPEFLNGFTDGITRHLNLITYPQAGKGDQRVGVQKFSTAYGNTANLIFARVSVINCC